EEFQRAFQKAATEEAIGLGVAKGVGSALNKMFPQLGKQARKAVAFARDKDIPLPAESLSKGGLKNLTAGLTERSILGDFVRRTKSNKILEFIDFEKNRLAPGIKSIEDTAQRGAALISDVFEKAVDNKNVAYQAIGDTVGRQTMIEANDTIRAAQLAMESLESAGIKRGAFYKRLKDLLSSDVGPLKTFDTLDQLRKAANKAKGKAETFEGANVFLRGVEQDLNRMGTDAGVNVVEELAKADKLFGKLRALQKIPNLKRFGDIKNGQGWIKSFVNENNVKAIQFLESKDPELHQQIIGARLQQIFDDSMKDTGGRLGRVFDGKKFAEYVKNNESFFKNVYGNERFKAIKGFANYARFIGEELARVDKDAGFMGVTGGLRGLQASALGSSIVTGSPTPAIMAAVFEGASGSLSRGLIDPSSATFRLFTGESIQGINDTLRTVLPQAVRMGEQLLNE
ncbi:MAG: hypothetical protein ACPGO7_01460, partial [Alphaproteobacteria bacterium]